MGKIKNRKYIIFISILCILLIAVNVLNITLAYFTDKQTSSQSSILTFGKIRINAYFAPNSGNPTEDFTFISSDVSTGSTLQRNIIIQNADDAEKCAVRIYFKFEIDAGNGFQDVTNQNYLRMGVVNSSNWTNESGSKYYYYNLALNTKTDSPTIDGSQINETISFTILETFGRDNLQTYFGVSNLENVKYKISLCCEAVQVANNGHVNEPNWAGEIPDAWPLKNNN